MRIEMAGTRSERYSIMQTCGSDRGRVGSAPRAIVRVTDPARVEATRGVVRAEARRQGWKWNSDGIVRV